MWLYQVLARYPIRKNSTVKIYLRNLKYKNELRNKLTQSIL